MKPLLIVVCSFAMALPVVAQDLEEAKKEHTTQALRDPSLQSTILGAEEAFKIESEKGAEKATVKLSFGGTTRRSMHVLVTAPVNKNAEQQSLASLQGLSGSAKGELGYSALLTTIDAVIDPVAAGKLCAVHGKDPGCDLIKLPAETRDEVEAILDGRTMPVGAKNIATADALCVRHGRSRGCDLRKLLEDERSLLKKTVVLHGMSTAIGVKGEFTRTKFDYLTKGTLASVSDSEPQYAGSVSYGILPHFKLPIGVLYFAGLGARYESGYEAQKKQQLCRPLADSPSATTCSDASIGAPTRSLKRIAEFRTRWYPSSQVVYDIVISRDLQKDVTGIEIPIAFIRGADNLFTGGVSIGWRSDTKEVTASVFVGAIKNLL